MGIKDPSAEILIGENCLTYMTYKNGSSERSGSCKESMTFSAKFGHYLLGRLINGKGKYAGCEPFIQIVLEIEVEVVVLC